MKATFVKRLDRFLGDDRLYKLEPALEGNDHVVVSAIGSAFDTGVSETYMFPASSSGDVTDWLELSGSERGVFDHEKVLRNAGYTIE